jgi:hypothetical protein
MKRKHSTKIDEGLSESTSNDESFQHRKSPTVSDVKKDDLVSLRLL